MPPAEEDGVEMIFNMYKNEVKSAAWFSFSRYANEQTDGQTDTFIAILRWAERCSSGLRPRADTVFDLH